MLPEPIHFSQDAVAGFHRDLQAALMAGVPLTFQATPVLDLPPRIASEPQLQLWERQLANRLSTAAPAPHPFATNSPAPEHSSLQAFSEATEFPLGYRAALLVNGFTKQMPLVLDGLATRRLARRRLTKMIRPTLMYLSVILWVAAICLAFFSDYIMPVVHTLREDMRLLPAIDTPARFDAAALRATFVALASILAFLLLLAWWDSGASRIASWLGGRKYRDLRAAATAVRTAGVLVHQGVPGNQAVRWACGLVGDEPAVRKLVTAIAESGPTDAALANYLHGQAAHLQHRSAQRLRTLSLMLPTLLVSGVGGLIALACSLLLLWPVFSLYKDLALPAM